MLGQITKRNPYLRWVRALHAVEVERHEQGVDLDQARVRLVIGFLILPWWFGDALFAAHEIHWLSVFVNLSFIAASGCIYGYLRQRELGTVWTRLIGIALDQGTCTLLLMLGGANASPLFFVYIWVAVGNALRFGKFYAAIATALGIAGFLSLCVLSPVWRENREIQISWALAIAVIPLYVAVLAERIHHARHIMRRTAEVMRHAALHDPLTGLANRAFFEEQLAGHMGLLREDPMRQTIDAVLYVDLDGFKEVNDAYGHATGDLLLKRVAVTLTARLRVADTVARLGGDEFAALLTGVRAREHVERIANQIVGDIAALTSVGDRPIRISASIGVALIDRGDSVPELIKRADQCMYVAKKNGKNRCVMPSSH